MKRLLIILLLIGCSLSLYGCNKPSDDKEAVQNLNGTGESEVNVNQENADKNATDYKESFQVQDIDFQPVDDKYLTDVYLKGLDFNPIRQVLDETEDGYYYFDRLSGRTMFYDKISKTSVILCNKPNCEHDMLSDECSSYASDYFGYYNGYLYTLTDDMNAEILMNNEFVTPEVVDYYLTRVKVDGTDQEIITKLFTQYFEKMDNGQYKSSEYAYSYTFHRGYFYQFLCSQYKDESIVSLKRWNLEKNHDEEVLLSQKLDTKLRLINGLRGFGPYIYFLDRRYYSDDLQENDAKLCRVHIDTGIIEELDMDPDFLDYFIMDGYMYYVVKPGNIVYKMNLETKETKLIIDTGDDTYLPYLSNITIDEDYIYFHNLSHNLYDTGDYDKECRVYDKEGELVDIIDLDGNNIFYDKVIGVSEDKLIIAWSSVEKGISYDYYTLDKSQIGTGVHKLEKMIEAPEQAP
ncbi:MAG: hypothetical protein K0S76_2318 [Herbinix sp.]|jgi:hypothetical protein|nr:hypothetical protein [Herbinix sp.]